MMRRDSEDSAPEQAAGLHSGSSPTLAARLYVEPHKLDPPTYIHIYIIFIYMYVYIYIYIYIYIYRLQGWRVYRLLGTP